MSRIIILPEQLEIIEKRLERIEKILHARQFQVAQPFIDSYQLMELFQISKKTLSTWKNERIIPFSQIRNKIYYKISDIDALLDKHYQSNIQ